MRVLSDARDREGNWSENAWRTRRGWTAILAIGGAEGCAQRPEGAFGTLMRTRPLE